MKRLLYFIYSYKFLIFFLLLGFFLFANVLDNKFVWLDTQYIVNDSEAQTFNLYNLLDGSSLTGTGYYRPVTAIYFTGIYLIFHQQAFFFHFFQILLYSLSAYLLFIFFKKFVRTWESFLLTLLFFIHPMNESIVGFISISGDILSIFFGLLALAFCKKERLSYVNLAFISFSLLVSILAKESGILFFFILILFQLLFNIHQWRKVSISLGLTFFLYVLLRILFDGFDAGKIYLVPISRLSLLQRLSNIPQIFFFYINNFFYPSRIGGIHEWVITKITYQNFYLPLFFDLIFCLSLFFLGFITWRAKRNKFKIYIFFSSIFFIGIVPYLQLIPLDYTVAARWFYISMIGIFGLGAVALEDTNFKKGYVRFIISTLLILYCSYLAYQTYHRNDSWTDDVTLFSRYAKTDDNFSVEAWLANAYLAKKDYKNALIHIQKSVSFFPYDNNLVTEAHIYQLMGNMDKAQEFYLKARKADNYASGRHSDSVYQILGKYYLSQQNILITKKLMTRGTQDYPDDDSLWTLLAIAEYKSGDRDSALYAAGKALIINPTNPIISTLYVAIKNNQPIMLYIK